MKREDCLPDCIRLAFGRVKFSQRQKISRIILCTKHLHSERRKVLLLINVHRVDLKSNQIPQVKNK